MRTYKRNSILLGITGFVVSCLLSTSSFGATMFSESFDGADGTTSFGSNFTLPGSPGNYQIQSNQGANPGVDFGPDGNRSLVRTVDNNYATVDFIAEITMTRNNTAAAVQPFWFGIGSGVPDATGYYTPQASIFVEAFPIWGPLTRFSANPPGNNTLPVDGAFGSDNTSMPLATTSRLRMTKEGNNLQFAIDLNSSTFVTADISSSVIDLSTAPNGIDFSSMDSYLFFGGGGNVTWDNFSVSAVPEPSSFALLLFGSVGVGMVRRKKKC